MLQILQNSDISDDSSPGISPEYSPVTSPQSAWRDCMIQLTGVSSVEGTPTHKAQIRSGVNRDPSPTPYYRKLAEAILLADQELKGESSNRRMSLTPVDACFSDQSQINTPKMIENQKKNYFFKASPKILEKTTKTEKNGS